MNPRLTITPATLLFDQPFHLTLSGLNPQQTVTLHAARGNWHSQATFTADANGIIDLVAHAPISGDYSGVDPMGLIWSMRYADPATLRFSDMWGDSLDPAPTHFRAETDGKTIAEGQVIREFLAEGVTRTEVRDDGLRGVLFEPADNSPHPAIIMLSGSGGGLNEHRAALFAAHGYAALALAYFNYEDLPKVLIEIPLEYFETAIRWLQTRPSINPDRIAVTGNSRGGELSLLLGATFPEVKAVIAYVPSGHVWAGIGTPEDNGKAAWTYRGKPVTHIPQAEGLRVRSLSMPSSLDDPIPLAPIFLASLETTPNTSAMTIPVEKTNGAVLLISGEDDQMWTSTLFSEMVIERLRERQFPYPFEHLHYPDAGHLILSPYLPTTVTASGHPLRKAYFAYGGTPRGGAFANADSWTKVFRFLDENLKA